MLNECFLDCISYELGDARDIDELAIFKNESDLLTIFKARGLAQFTESKLRPLELAKVVAQKTLARSHCEANEIDCLLLASDSFWDDAIYTRSCVNQLLKELNLVNAYPIGISIMECTSSSVALQMAFNLVQSRQANNVLVIATNKVKPGCDDERIIQPGISILSDAAVATLVSNKNTQAFKMLAVEQCHAPHLEDLNPEENFAEFVKMSVDGFAAVSQKVFKRLGQSVTDFKWLMTNNYLQHIIMMIAKEIGFTQSQCYLKNIPRFAHAHTADTLINLADMAAEDSIKSHDQLLLLSNSPTSWGAVALLKV